MSSSSRLNRKTLTMANSITTSEPVPEINLINPNTNPSDDGFDSIEFPPLDLDYLANDITLPEGFISDLFDDEFFNDISFPLENDAFFGDDSSNATHQHQHSSDDHSSSSRVLNSPSRDSGSCDHHRGSDQDSGACQSAVNGFLNSPSPESGVDSASRLCSPNSSGDQEIKLEEERAKEGREKDEKEGKESSSSSSSLKRKIDKEDENTTDSSSKSSKIRRSSGGANSGSEAVGDDDDDKRKARLMRNRESAQLSRQRKKHYVEELEDKVKSMHSVIADLNNKISYFMAENASLRQQLTGGAGGVCPPPPGMYPPMAPMPYPWIPYPMRAQGSQVPLVPIPKLKPQQPLSAPKPKKESKKDGKSSKTKKVASVSFLGLLFFMLLFGGLVPFVDVNYRAKREVVSNSFGFTDVGLDGRILTVNGSHKRVGVGLHGDTESNIRKCGVNGKPCKRILNEGVNSKRKQSRPGSPSLPGSDGFVNSKNSSEPLVASLYVPRNDKLVKIDGNLIINSVLASEKAMASGVKTNKNKPSEKSPQTGLAIPRNLVPALAGMNVERHPHVYRISKERQKALNSASRDSYKEKSKPADGSLQKWFREGLEGPIFSSGMCTEVFQFDTSPAPGAIVPATSSANISATQRPGSGHLSRRNRRILGHLPVTLGESEFNSTKDHSDRPSDNGNGTASSMIVSVLVDPRENGDGDGDGVISQKSMSRIFVVVLMDSVKYVTYSCILPLKGSGPHLVTT